MTRELQDEEHSHSSQSTQELPFNDLGLIGEMLSLCGFSDVDAAFAKLLYDANPNAKYSLEQRQHLKEKFLFWVNTSLSSPFTDVRHYYGLMLTYFVREVLNNHSPALRNAFRIWDPFLVETATHQKKKLSTVVSKNHSGFTPPYYEMLCNALLSLLNLPADEWQGTIKMACSYLDKNDKECFMETTLQRVLGNPTISPQAQCAFLNFFNGAFPGRVTELAKNNILKTFQYPAEVQKLIFNVALIDMKEAFMNAHPMKENRTTTNNVSQNGFKR